MLRHRGAGAARGFFATPTTLSLRTYLTILPVALAAAAFAVPGAEPRVMLAWLGAGVLAELGVGVFFLAGWWLVDRVSHARVSVVAVVLAAYAVRGIILVVVTQSLDVPDTTSSLLRIVASMANMSLWTFLVGAAWEARAQYHRRLQQAAGRVADLRTELAYDAVDNLPLAREVHDVQAGLTSLLEQFDTRDVDAWAAQLQQRIDEQVRPLSHRLASVGSRPMGQRGRLRQIIWRAARQPVALVPIGLVLGIVTSTNAALRYPTDEALLVVAVYLPLLVLALALVVILRALRVPAVATNFVLLVLLASVMPLILTSIVDRILPRAPDPAGPVSVMLAALAVVVVTSVVQAALAVSTEELDRLQGGIDALDLLIEGQWTTQGSLSSGAASYLHDVLQSRLTAVRIEATASSGELDPVLLADAQRLLERDVYRSRPPVDPVSELREAVHSWSGVVNVDMHIDPGLPPEDPRVARLVSFAQEAIANAARHGEASAVEINLWEQDGTVHCRVRDDGTWATPTSPGLGLTATRDLAISVEADERGTTVSASAAELWG